MKLLAQMKENTASLSQKDLDEIKELKNKIKNL